MPPLKQLNCTLQNAQSRSSSVPMQEHNTIYADGYVETYIAVPSSPTPFSIRLQSQGFIAPGLAMFVFIDGVYQCNRNRTNLKIPNGSKAQTEVDFVVRQREEAMPDGTFRGKLWRFGDVNAVSIPGGASYLAVDVGTIEVLVLRCLPLGNSTPKPSTIMGPKHAIKAHFVPVGSESSDEESPSSDDSVSGLGGMVDGASDYPLNRGRKGVDWEAGPSSGKGAAQNWNSRGRSNNRHSKDWVNLAETNNHKSSTDTQLGLSRCSHSRREKKVSPGGMINPAGGTVDCADDEVAALISPAVVININSNAAPSGIENARAPPRRGKVWEVQSDEDSGDSTDTLQDARIDHNRRQTYGNTKGTNPSKSAKSRDRNRKLEPTMPGTWVDPGDQDQNQASDNGWDDDDKGSNAESGDSNEPTENDNFDWNAGDNGNGNDNDWGDNEKKDDWHAKSKGLDGRKDKKSVGNHKKTKKGEASNNGGSGNAWGNNADKEGWDNDNTGPDAPNVDNNNTNGNGNGSPAAWESPTNNKSQGKKGSWNSPNENNNQQNGWGADDDGKSQQNNSGPIVNTQKKSQKQKSNSPNDQQNSWGNDDKPKDNISGGDNNTGDAQQNNWEADNNGNAQEDTWVADNDGTAQQNNSVEDNNGDTQHNSWAGDNNGDTQQNTWAGDKNGDTQKNDWTGDNNGNVQSNGWAEDKHVTQNNGNIPSKNAQASGGKVADKDNWRKPPYPSTGKPPYVPDWTPSPPPIHFASTAPQNVSGLGIGNSWSTLPNVAPTSMATPRRYKPYWSTWRQSDGIQSKLTPMDPADGIWEPLCRVPLGVARQNNLSHQVHLSQPAQYSHRQSSPTYMDSFENPYAVFVFHYRSKEILEQILQRELDEPEMAERKRLAKLSNEELIEEVLKAQAATSQGGSGSKGSSDPKRLAGLNKAFKASYKVSKLTDDEFASDTDPDHDWGWKEKTQSNVPPIWNSASPPNQDFLADWTGGGNAGAMTAATSAIVPAAAYGGSGYAAPTAAPFADNGAAQDWNAMPATQYKVPTATGRTPFTGKVNFDGTVPRQPYVPPPLSPSVNNGGAQSWNAVPVAQYQMPTGTGVTPFTGKVNFDGTVPRQPYIPPPLSPSVKNEGAQDEKTALAPQIKVLKTHGGSSWTGKSNWDGEQKPATEYWKDDDKAEDDKSGGGDKGGSQW